MRVRVDHAADAVYLNLTDRPIKDSAESPTASLSTTTTKAASSASKSSTPRSAPMTPRSSSNSVLNYRRWDDEACREMRAEVYVEAAKVKESNKALG